MRRIHLPRIAPGAQQLPDASAHHLRNVLRLSEGAQIELFDDAGNTAIARITQSSAHGVVVEVAQIIQPMTTDLEVVIASAIPKGDRAEWMIEKLSELGIAEFIPLKTERSVVHPKGENKMDRWRKIAEEAARQSHRSGVMRIAAITSLEQLVAQTKTGCYLSTAPDAKAAADFLSDCPLPTAEDRLTLFIGPEGGWSPKELETFQQHNLTGISLGTTILRVETAAMAAGVLASVLLAQRRG